MKNLATTRSNGRRGVTLSELLVALLITLIFVGGVAAAFVQIIRASDEASAQIRAHAAARAATESIGRELRQLTLPAGPFYQEFLLFDQTLSYGDNIDNDNDGRIDEEVFDGFDDELGGAGDWTAAADNHLQVVAGQVERAPFVGVPDYGDFAVDEDVLFSRDIISFIIPPSATSLRRRVTYRVGSFDGEDNVLLRAVTIAPTQGGYGVDPEEIEPVVYEVVSFDVLAWNANDDAVGPTAGRPYWIGEWDATLKTFPPLQVINSPFGTPPFKIPAAFLVSITVNAEGIPLSEKTDWPPPANGTLRTVTVTTIVSVESIIKDTRYREYVRE